MPLNTFIFYQVDIIHSPLLLPCFFSPVSLLYLLFFLFELFANFTVSCSPLINSFWQIQQLQIYIYHTMFLMQIIKIQPLTGEPKTTSFARYPYLIDHLGSMFLPPLLSKNYAASIFDEIYFMHQIQTKFILTIIRMMNLCNWQHKIYDVNVFDNFSKQSWLETLLIVLEKKAS